MNLGVLRGLATFTRHRAPVTRVYTFAGSPYLYQAPDSLDYIVVKVVGGGGGGGGAVDPAGTGASVAAGGGGGGYAEKQLTREQLPWICTITIGDGGTAGSTAGGDGGAGGTSSFAGTGITTVQATGGGGGEGETAATANTSIVGGDPGAGSGGDINIGGDYGGNSVSASSMYAAQGHGGCSQMGRGVKPNDTDAGGNGLTGLLYGGGGSGAHARTDAPSSFSGGVGAAGVAVITEYYL